MDDIIHVVLAGGKSTRLFPLTSEDNPKQFMNLLPNFKGSMLQFNVDLFKYISNETYIITNIKYKQKVEEQIPNKKVIKIYEPEIKGTGVQIQLALSKIKSLSDILLITPTDHYYENRELFILDVERQIELQKNNDCIVLMQQEQKEINTQYGWIALESNSSIFDNVYNIMSFIEKPTYSQQQRLFQLRKYYFNMGIFIVKQSNLLNIIRDISSELYNFIIAIRYHNSPLSVEYKKFTNNISFDSTVIQKTKKLLAVVDDFGWMDIGLKENLIQINSSLKPLLEAN